MFFRNSSKPNPDTLQSQLTDLQKAMSDLNAKMTYIITVNELIKAELKHLKALNKNHQGLS